MGEVMRKQCVLSRHVFCLITLMVQSMHTAAILPPNLVQGAQMRNVFLTQTDSINYIAWTAPYGQTPVSYKIYRDSALTNLLATIVATEVLHYYDHNRNAHSSYSYYIVSVDQDGSVSEANSVTIPQ